MTRAETDRFERFVLRRQAAVHHLALRMLSDRAEAEDATQEVFLRALRGFDRFDPTRDEVAWIHTVAVRVVLNRLRAKRPRRRALEARIAAGRVVPVREEAAVERREREEIVADHVAHLPPDERAAVTLTYYAGLPQTEVAAALSLPRSTVQSRVSRGLAALRASLTSAGSLAVVPSLEDVMRGTAVPPVPEALTRSLLHAAARAAAGSPIAVPLFMLGGLAVTKSALLVAAAVAVVFLGSGYAVGRAFAGRGDDVPAESGVSALEHARVVEENARLREAAAGRLAAAAPAAGSPPRREAGSAAGESPAAVGAEAAGAGASPAGGESAALDWNRFSKLWTDSIDVFGREGDEERRLTPDEQKKVVALWAAYQELSALAHELSPHPFFDARVLPGLVGAMFSAPLDLPAEARAAVDARARAAIERAALDVAAAEERPLALYEARSRVIDAVMETVRASTPEASRERLAKIERAGEMILTGDRTVSEVAVVSGKVEDFAADALRSWGSRLDLDESQANALRPVAEGFAREALDAWRRRGMDREGATPSAEDRRAFEREVLRAQVEAERAFEAALTPAQREKHRRMPYVVRPNLGGSRSVMQGGGGI